MNERKLSINEILLQGSKEKLTSTSSSNLQKQILTNLSFRNLSTGQPLVTFPVLSSELHISQILSGETKGFGTGSSVWPAAQVLIKYFELHHPNFQNRVVLELGAGTGIVGLALACFGAKVVLTDQAQLLPLLKQNKDQCLANHPHIRPDQITIRELNWGQPLDVPFSFDYIVISDCVLPKLYPLEPLVDAIAMFCTNSTVVYLSVEYRYHVLFDAKDRFKELLEEKGLEWNEIPSSEHHPQYQAPDIEIWRVQTTKA